jgi:hypothetical protein
MRASSARPLLAFLPLLAGGCPLLQELADEDAPPPAPPTMTLDAEAVHEYLRSSTQCREALADAVGPNYADYASQVNPDGSLRRQRHGVFVRGIPGAAFRRCDAVIDRPPPDEARLAELHGATLRLVDTARAYATATRELEAWLESPEAGGGEGLRPHHRALVAAWELGSVLDGQVALQVDALVAENDPAFLGLLEARGRELELRTWALMADLRPLHACLVGDELREVCAPLHEAFEATATSFDEAVAALADEQAEVFWMQTFRADLESYRATARDWMGAGRRDDEELEQLRRSHATLVLDANTLDFGFVVAEPNAGETGRGAPGPA